MCLTDPPLSFLASQSKASPARRRAGDHGVMLGDESSGCLRRRDRHVDDTGAGIACRVPGCTALVVRHATDLNRGHVARRRNGSRCGGGRWRRSGPGDDRGRGERLARGGGGAHDTDNGSPGHEAGGRVAVIPVRAVAAVAAVDVVVHGRRAVVLDLRRGGLPGCLVLARCRLALVLILAHALLPLGLRLLSALLRIRPRSASLALLSAPGLHGSPAAPLASALRGTATRESPARGSASTGESAALAAAPAAAAASPPASLRICLAHEAQHEHGRNERRPDTP